VLGRLGLANDPVEYGECVMQSAQELADQLERLGIDVARAVLCCEPNEPFANEELVREAEAYLDRAADRDVSCADFRGVLFLAAASITQQRKLTLRLWEYEINRTDSDDQLLDHALQSAARSRLLAGLAAIRGGSLDRGLADLSEVVRLGSGSAPTSGLRVYAAQAGIMSSVIRRSEPVYPRYRARQVRHTPSSVTRAVSAVLGDFDLARPEQREEAGHRLDQWCGLNVAPRQKHLGRLQTLAN
jgi:hypothetical protein